MTDVADTAFDNTELHTVVHPAPDDAFYIRVIRAECLARETPDDDAPF